MGDMNGKICLVTGATSGIGLATAIELGRAGAHVIIAARSVERGGPALEAVRQSGGCGEVLAADLSSMSEVRALALGFRARHPRLDVLVNNAGAIFMKRELTVDGFERTFATNHLQAFLLTCLLVDRLSAAPAARVINVASTAHWRGRIDFDDLMMSERRYTGLSSYAHSKLANLLFTFELARRLGGTRVTANCLHPGVVATQFGSKNPIFRKLFQVGSLFMIGPVRGARTTLFLATSPDVEGVSGRYFVRRRVARSSSRSRDAATAKRLWEVSETLVEPWLSNTSRLRDAGQPAINAVP